jgi:cysteine synthase B
MVLEMPAELDMVTATNPALAVFDQHIAVPASVVDCVGNTPLLHLKKIAAEFRGIAIMAKAEWVNPGGSVKDRAALSMILDGERNGLLRPGKVILDATSGNTGIAYAMLGAARGYHVRLCLPWNASHERQRILKAYGADLVLTDPAEGTDGAIRKAREMYANDPFLYFYPDQYNNPANWMAHYNGTAEEIWKQTEGSITHFVAGLGTSGTFMGTSRRLRELNPQIRMISFQPDSGFHGIEGLKHMDTAIKPGIYDPEQADENLVVATEEAYRMVKRLAREEGVLVGVSSGAALAACFQVAEQLRSRGETGVIVTVFPDNADKYLSENFWEERS